MAEETKPVEKKKVTKDYLKRQIELTSRQVNALQDELQQTLGVLNYLRYLEKDFDLPDAPPEPKPALEVK